MNYQRFLKIISSLFMASSLAAPMAHAAPNTFVYEGVLQDSSGPVLASTQVILRIYDPALSCLLYEEMQTVTPSADGSFSVLVGSELADAKRTSNDAGLAMSKIFLSSGAVRAAGSSFCTSGYSAVSSDGRRLVVNINGVDLNPSIEISSAPFAISAQSADEALKVGGYDSTKLLRNDGINAVPALTDTNVDFLMSLLGGTLAAPTAAGDVANKSYVDSKASLLLPTSTSFAGDVSGAYNSLVVDKIQGKVIDTTNITTGKVLKYDGAKWVMGADETGAAPSLTSGKIWIGNASNGPAEVLLTGDATLDSAGSLTLKNVGTAGTNGLADKIPQITTDAQGRVTAITEVAVNDSTKLPLSGGNISGAIDMGGNNLTSVGHITMANDRFFQLPNTSATPAPTPNAAGQMWYSGGSIKYYDGANTKTLGVSGSGISSFNGATNAIQMLMTPGTTGNAPNWATNTTTGEHTLNIPMANAAASVTAGLISNADYVAMMSRQSNALTSTKIWVGNASGVAEARALTGDVFSVSEVGSVTLVKTTTGEANKILALDGSGVTNVKGLDIQTGTGKVTLQTSGLSANYILTMPVDDGNANQVLTTDGAGILSWSSLPGSGVSGSAALTNGKIWVGDSITNKASEVMLTGDATLSSTGVLTLATTGVGTSGGPVGASNSIPVISYDEKGRLTAVSATALDDTTKLPLAGGVMSGELSFANGTYLRLPSSVTAGTAAGQMWLDGANIKYYDGTGTKTLSTGGAATTVSVSDIQGTLGAQIPTSCTTAETMIWSSPSDAFVCQNIKQLNAATFSTGPQTVYVGISGSDADCNGTTIDPYSVGVAPNCAFQTLQKAVDSLPDLVRHPVVISILSNLAVTGPNLPPLARIDKSVVAQNLTSGPLITVKAHTGTITLDGVNNTGSSGIVVSSSARGVYIQNITFMNFKESALRVEGGLAVVENSTFNDNIQAISAEDGARVMLDGNVSITLSYLSGSSGIRVSQGSVGVQGALNINLGTGLNNRGLVVEQGTISIEGGASVTGVAGTNYQSAVEVSSGGSLDIRENVALDISMGGNTNSEAVNIRGGRLNVSQTGILRLQNIGGRGLTCENTAHCEFYGNFEFLSGSSSNPVRIRGNSILNSQGNISITASPGFSGSAFVEITDNSTMKVDPFNSAFMNFSNSGATPTAFRLKNGAQLLVEPGSTYTFTMNGFAKLFEATTLSSIKAQSPNFISGSYPASVIDESSRFSYVNFNFSEADRSCPSGMTAIAKGTKAFCIDTNSNGSLTYTGHMNSCSNRGLKLCSKYQYAMYCTVMGMSVTSSWTDDFTLTGCNPLPSYSVSGGTSSEGATMPGRCCL